MVVHPIFPASIVVFWGFGFVAQAAGEVPSWANLASTTGLGIVLGYLVLRIIRGELVSRKADEREAQLFEALVKSQEAAAEARQIALEAHQREDRLMNYLETEAGKQG